MFSLFFQQIGLQPVHAIDIRSPGQRRLSDHRLGEHLALLLGIAPRNLGSIKPVGTKSLHGDPPWIDTAVAIVTGRLFAVNFQLLAHRQLREIRILRIKTGHIRRWIRRRIIEETLAQPDRSQDRMGILAR